MEHFWDADRIWLIEAIFKLNQTGFPESCVYLLTRANAGEGEAAGEGQPIPGVHVDDNKKVVHKGPWPTTKHISHTSPVHGYWHIRKVLADGAIDPVFYLDVVFSNHGVSLDDPMLNTFFLNPASVWDGTNKTTKKTMQSEWTRYKSTIWKIENLTIRKIKTFSEAAQPDSTQPGGPKATNQATSQYADSAQPTQPDSTQPGGPKATNQATSQYADSAQPTPTNPLLSKQQSSVWLGDGGH